MGCELKLTRLEKKRHGVHQKLFPISTVLPWITVLDPPKKSPGLTVASRVTLPVKYCLRVSPCPPGVTEHAVVRLLALSWGRLHFLQLLDEVNYDIFPPPHTPALAFALVMTHNLSTRPILPGGKESSFPSAAILEVPSISELAADFPELCPSTQSSPPEKQGQYRGWAMVSQGWPRCDLNTQPSDLESDALPLRHEVGVEGCSCSAWSLAWVVGMSSPWRSTQGCLGNPKRSAMRGREDRATPLGEAGQVVPTAWWPAGRVRAQGGVGQRSRVTSMSPGYVGQLNSKHTPSSCWWKVTPARFCKRHEGPSCHRAWRGCCASARRMGALSPGRWQATIPLSPLVTSCSGRCLS